jgi:hypothetical protein
LPLSNHHVEDQAAPAGDQIEFMTIFDIAAALNDDVGMRLEQAEDLVAGRDGSAEKDASLGLPDDPLDQRAIVTSLGSPWLDPRVATAASFVETSSR